MFFKKLLKNCVPHFYFLNHAPLTDSEFSDYRLPYQNLMNSNIDYAVNNVSYSFEGNVDVKSDSMASRDWDYFNAKSSLDFSINDETQKLDKLVVHSKDILLQKNPEITVNGGEKVEILNWFYQNEYHQYLIKPF